MKPKKYPGKPKGHWCRIPKKTKGKFRNIFKQTKEFAKFTKSVNKHILSKYPISIHAHGFVPGRSVVTNAKKHIGHYHTLCIDISDFFDSISDAMLEDKISRPLRWRCLVGHYNGKRVAAQGLSTSPMLANIAMLDVDKKIEAALYLEDDVVYTRYGDDIAISFPSLSLEKTPGAKMDALNKFKRYGAIVCNIIENSGFRVNRNKTHRYYLWGGYRRICGVSVGTHTIKAPYRSYRKLRAAKHQNNKASIQGLYHWTAMPEPKKPTTNQFI